MTALCKPVNMGKNLSIDRFLGTRYCISVISSDVVRVTAALPSYISMLLQRCKTARCIKGPLCRVETHIVEDDVEGKFGHLPFNHADAAARLVGLLFLARSSRPDGMFATNFLDRHAFAWSLASKKRMQRLFECLESTINHGIIWRIRQSDMSQIMLKMFFDADHGDVWKLLAAHQVEITQAQCFTPRRKQAEYWKEVAKTQIQRSNSGGRNIAECSSLQRRLL